MAFAALSWFGLASLVRFDVTGAQVALAALASALPELDHPESSIGSFFRPISCRIKDRFGHRTITHSFLGLGVVALLFSPLILISWVWWLAVMVGIFSHIFLDIFNTQGVPWFWPYERRVGFFPRLKIETSSPAEGVILAALVVGAFIAYPLGQMGLMGTVRYVLADIDQTYNEYRQLAATREVYLLGRFQDNFTKEILEGEYKIVDLQGQGYVILVHDQLKTVSKSPEAQLYPFKVHLVPGSQIKETISSVNLSGRRISDLLPYLDLTKEHYISGELELELDGSPPLFREIPSGKGNSLPLSISSTNLKLQYASWRDLSPLSDLKVKSGYVVIKHILRGGELLQLTNTNLNLANSSLDGDGSSPPLIKMEFEVASLSDLLIKVGDRLEEGQLIGRKESKELIEKRAELELAQERYEAGLLEEAKVRELEQELAIIERQHEVRAKASGVVESLEIKGINEAVQVAAYILLSVDEGGLQESELPAVPEACPPSLPAPCDVAKVVKGIDGDTIDVLVQGHQERVRMIGVDTPETVHPNKPVECYGREASAFTKEKLAGKVVYLTYGHEQRDRDKYGRLLAYIWLDLDGDPDPELFNEELIARGYGRAYTKFSHPLLNQFLSAEAQARSAALGLWGNCYGR